MRFNKYFLLMLLSILWFSCNTINVYEKTIAFPKQQWSSKTRLNFTFIIKDTTGYYNIYFVLRHAESYHFNNIWVDVNAGIAKDSLQKQHLNIQLANGHGWLGTSMDDIIEQRLLINKQPALLRAGSYRFSVNQIMREDPLEHVLNAGIRIEKIVQ